MIRFAFGLSLALAVAPAVAHAQDDDDDEEEAPQKPAPAPSAQSEKASPVTPAPAAKAGGEEGTPAAAKPATSDNSQSAAAQEQAGYLQGRAESTSPNELIHTVERKTYTAAGHLELTLYPAALQLNSKFTNTDGVAVAVSYALQENMGLQLFGFYNVYAAGDTGLSTNLLNIHARAQAADALYLDYGALGAFEIAPIYGKFAFYEGSLLQFRFVLNAGAGLGHTEVQLTPGSDGTQALYGDAGYRFMGDLGLGFRVLIGSRFALRIEARDLLYTARVDHIDGCSLTDLGNIGGAGAVSGGCNQKNFNPSSTSGPVAKTTASDLLKDNSSDVVNDVGFFLGGSILF